MENYIDKIRIFEIYDNNKNHNMNVFSYIPDGDIQEMKVIFVMSGCLRNALDYLKNWIDIANKRRYIIISPEFDKENYSIGDHEYGNLIDIQYDYSSQDIYTPFMEYDTNIKDKLEWVYKIIDEIYLKFIKTNNIDNNGYIIFGHSSGSQFVHRFLMFGDSKYCKEYFAANAGLYTFFDENKNYPYGIKNLKKYEDIIKKSLQKDVYIMLGEQDIDTNYLNCLPMDNEEGITRIERGINYYNSAKKYAEKYNLEFNWHLKVMANVDHSNNKVIPYIDEILNKE